MYSILRKGQYQWLATRSLDGKIVDLGGSTRSGYHKLLRGTHTVTTVNINKDYGCDVIADLEERFPFEDGSFDHVLALNILEHVFNTDGFVSEAARVVRQGGKIIISTPMIFQIHGSPSDYVRFTDAALRRLAEKNGLEVLTIDAIGKGLFSVMFQLAGGILPGEPVRKLGQRIAEAFDGCLGSCFKRYRAFASRIPLGYMLEARKR